MQLQNQLKIALSCLLRYSVAFQRHRPKILSHAAEPCAEERTLTCSAEERTLTCSCTRKQSFSLAPMRTSFCPYPTPHCHTLKGSGHNQKLNTKTLSESKGPLSRKFSVDAPYHKFPISKVLRFKLVLPALPHPRSPYTLKKPLERWMGEFRL